MNFDTPYPSNRSPVFASNIVATSQPLATQAGLSAMNNGGNAVDAALAAAITLTVVEPNNNGIGSDAFAIVWDGTQLHGLNASGRSAAGLDAERFSGRKTMPALGWDTVTVPGAVSAWVELSARFGKLPFADLFAAAVNYAQNGYQLGPKTGYYWHYAARTYSAYDSFMATFMQDGKAPAIGSRVILADHANTLREIAATKGESFYRGNLAEQIVADAARHDHPLCAADLADHKAEWVDTISCKFGEQELHEIPPNGQGLMALIACGIANNLDLQQYHPDSVDSIHLQVEATRIAYATIERELADLQFMRTSPAALLSSDKLSQAATAIDPQTANINPTSLGAGADTVYLTTADQDGMMVSFIQSNYKGFGSGIVIPGTGISMQNRGCGFTLEPGHPNEVGGGKKPYHTIIPGFVTSEGEPVMSFGVMGGHMQAQGHLQMMVRIGLHGQNPQAASDAPRWHLFEDGRLALEDGFSDEVAAGLAARGHHIVRNNPEHLFGGAQLIHKLQDGYCAGSDHRKEGLAAGF